MLRSEVLSSAANPLLRQVRRAIQGGDLTEDGCVVVETFHVLEEAVRSGLEIRAAVASPSVSPMVERLLSGRQCRLAIASAELVRRTAGTETSQGVIALVRPPQWTLEAIARDSGLTVILDGVQDPGNAGTILRSAEAFGAGGVLFLKGSVSPFNPKTVRASAGSLFRVPYAAGVDPDAAWQALSEVGEILWAAAAADRPGNLPDLREKCAIVIGNESRGVSPLFREHGRPISIPTRGVESLNAAVAASILLYEASRQRTAG